MAQSTVVCSHLNLSNSYEINREFMDNHYLNITVTVKSDKPNSSYFNVHCPPKDTFHELMSC